MSLRAVAFLVIGVSTPVPAWTQDEITETEFVSRIGAEHPAARAMLGRLGAAEAALARAKQLQNPRVEYLREAPSSDAVQDTVVAAWVLPIDGRRGLAIDAARASVAGAEADRAAELVRVRLAARAAFADWSAAHERRARVAELLALSGDLARKTRLRADAGEESGLTARRIELQRAAVAAELAEAEAAYARARATALVWRPDLADATPAPVAPSAGSAGALAEGPGLTALRHGLEAARLQERLAGRFWTAPELQGGIQWQDQAGVSVSGPVFGIGWSIPIFDRGQPARREAARRREAAEAQLSLALSRQAAGLKAAGVAAEVLLAATTSARQASQQAGGVVEAALASFAAGEATVTDLLDALRAAHDARRRDIEARAAAAAALRDVEAVQAGLERGDIR